jgi:hypothetical protein
MMNTLTNTHAIACMLSAPALSFAQATQAPVTRASVRADLVQLEKAGWNPDGNLNDYPVGLQAAEAKIHPQQPGAAVTAPMTVSGVTGDGVDGVRSPFYDGA